MLQRRHCSSIGRALPDTGKHRAWFYTLWKLDARIVGNLPSQPIFRLKPRALNDTNGSSYPSYRPPGEVAITVMHPAFSRQPEKPEPLHLADN